MGRRGGMCSCCSGRGASRRADVVGYCDQCQRPICTRHLRRWIANECWVCAKCYRLLCPDGEE